MAWFKRSNPPQAKNGTGKVKVPEGLWTKCVACSEAIYTKDIERNLNVCPKCRHHYRLSTRQRLELLLDEGSFTEFDAGMVSADFLEFKDSKSYQDRIDAAVAKGGSKDAVVCGHGERGG
jgi:acetyl-CoA carboxylase carboxyl transferase subunit beta